MYYNTTKEIGALLKEYQEKATTQDQVILRMYKGGHKLSASMIEAALNYKWPITSIRRSITDLFQKGEIKRLPYKVMGKYNKKEYIYEVATN